MKESETIEFKKSLAELGEGLNSMAAILNKHAAGELWFGIKNDGTPVGMDVTETTLRKISQSIAAHIEPKIFPEVSNVLLSGKSCILVSFSGSEKPYYSHGHAYMRVADEDLAFLGGCQANAGNYSQTLWDFVPMNAVRINVQLSNHAMQPEEAVDLWIAMSRKAADFGISSPLVGAG